MPGSDELTTLRAKILSGQRVCCVFAAIPHPVSLEICASSGIDAICIDAEHAQIDRERIEDLIRAADSQRVPALVRVPGHQSEWIAAVLDAGAAGVLVPRVSSAAQAQAAVMATRYPPVGQRGVGPGRASRYGYDMAGYAATANEALLLAIQVETAEGLANIDAIAAVEGIDLIFVGPGDLSVSMGATGAENLPRLHAAIKTIVAATTAAGRVAGLFVRSPLDIAKWAPLGIGFFIVSSDAMLLAATLAETVKMIRAQSGQAQA